MCSKARRFPAPLPCTSSIITNSAAHHVVSSSGSWVELEELIAVVSRRESLTGPQDSISSALQGELERILLEAQLECERSKDRLVWISGGLCLFFPTCAYFFRFVFCCGGDDLFSCSLSFS